MTTIRQLLTGSLRLINVVQANESPTADDMDISLMSLRAVMDSWSTERLAIFLLKQYYFPTIAGQRDYTMGPGGTWNITRPMGIAKATVSYGGVIIYNTDHWEMNNGPTIQDIPMELLTDAQYAAIGMKNQPSTYPVKLYDNGDYPLRTISVWPVPTTNEPLTLWLIQPLNDPDNLDVELNLPKGYERALRFTMAVELAPEFGKEVPPEVVKTMVDAKGYLKRINSRNQIMRADLGVLTDLTSIYNYNLGNTVPN